MRRHPLRKRRYCPGWLADALDCSACGHAGGRTPSGYMGCVYPGHARLVVPEDVAVIADAALTAAMAAGLSQHMTREKVTRMAWEYLDGLTTRRPKENGVS